MSWLEPFVQDMLSEIQASLVNIPACSVGQDIAKSWLFACSYSEFRSLAGTCLHEEGHQSVAGARDERGNFLSQRTAEYPSQLASSFSDRAVNLFSSARPSYPVSPCSLKFALASIPKKPRSTPPTAAQDGGGIYFLPDWSLGPRYQSDSLHDLRKEWQSWLLGNRIPLRLQQHVAEASNNPLFSAEETEWLRSSFKRFSDSHSPCQDWDFSVKEGQPYCLSALERLSTMLGDKDTSLFPALQKGVPTGFDGDIPRSHTLRPRNSDNADATADLLVCEGNWQGAEADPALLQELIEEEVSAGYIEEVPSLEAAYERWGRERVAVGRVNIVKAPGRAPRLVIDNSICNTNQNCHVPEQFSLPSLQDIQAAYPPREDEEPVSGFSLDVKGAHKTSLVREQDRGLLGLRQQERLFFYRVCIHAYLDDKLRFTGETLAFFAHLSSREWRPRPLRPPPTSSVESAADAFGKGNDCGVGGWLLLPCGRLLWFSHRYTVKDFLDLGLPMQPDANLDISSYETLAQCFVLLAFWKLSMWSSITGVTLDCSHIAGEKNNDADLLSRWDGSTDLPDKFLASNRIELSLSEFWLIRFQVTLFPADTFLKWQLPSADSLGPTNRGSKKRK
ncbi:PAO [Symbiodinium sp. CCMP2592]|nr:PAO [Symbiodinium sp. CCMP2592]